MIPVDKGDGRWVVFVPKKLSSSGKRVQKYFRSKNQAEKFIAAFKTEIQTHGRLAITPEERQWVQILRTELEGDSGRLREILDHWRRTGRSVKTITAASAAKQFMAFRFRDKLMPETVNGIRWRLNAFSDHFGDRLLHQVTPGQIESWLQEYTEGQSRKSIWKTIRPMFAWAKRNRFLAENPIDELKAPATGTPKRDVYTLNS